jgi:high affinity sulfate transporter 1
MTAAVAAGPAPRRIPILRWFPKYQRDWLMPDTLAGLAVWAVMIPESMAYSSIVGVPPTMGLYTVVPPLVAYAILGTSRSLVVGPDTATGLISALTVGAIAVQGTATFNSLTSTLAVLVGILFLLLGVLRMGWVAAFVPAPVMRGFIEGLVCVTIIGQVPHLIGITGTSGNFFAKLWFTLRHLGDAQPAAALLGLLSLAAMLVLRRFAPLVPAALAVAAAATLGVSIFHVGGISVVGNLPSGLPHLVWPVLDPKVLWQLLPGALSIVLVGYAETLGAAKAASFGHGSDIDPNQELVAHGPANILSGLFGGFLAVGSLSKTSVAMAAGARSQVANLIAAGLSFLTLVFLTPLFRGLPHPALAAIVIAAMLHLSKADYLRVLFHRSRWEFGVAMLVIAGELTLGVLQGIGLGVIVSLLLLIYRASHPRGEVLGQLPGTEAYRYIGRHPEAITFPGLLLWRLGGDLFFASFGKVQEDLGQALALHQPRHLLLDAEDVSMLDTSAADELLAFIRKLHKNGMTVGFARVHYNVRERMQLAGIEVAIGAANFHDRITDGVRAYQESGVETGRSAAKPG